MGRWAWSVLVVAAVGCAGPDVVDVGPAGGPPGTSRSAPPTSSSTSPPTSPSTGGTTAADPGAPSARPDTSVPGSRGPRPSSATQDPVEPVVPAPVGPVPGPAPPDPVPGSPVGPGDGGGGGDEEEAGEVIGAPLAIPTFTNTSTRYSAQSKEFVEGEIRNACGDGTLCVSPVFEVEPGADQAEDCYVLRFEQADDLYPGDEIIIVVNNENNCGVDVDGSS